jgi:hypothetical protein
MPCGYGNEHLVTLWLLRSVMGNVVIPLSR